MPVRWELRAGTRFATVRPWAHDHHGVPVVVSGDLLAAVILDGLGEPIVEDDVVRGPLSLPTPASIVRRLEHTTRKCQQWSGLIDYSGPHRDQVLRSALVIKALANAGTGALPAAPTTSLPEVVGSSRNFDYRFGWVRDASFMIDALTRLGLS